MPELREVFEMVTKQTEPDVDAWREQERRQRRASRNRRLGALAVAAAIGLVIVIAVVRGGADSSEPVPLGEPPGPRTAPGAAAPDATVTFDGSGCSMEITADRIEPGFVLFEVVNATEQLVAFDSWQLLEGSTFRAFEAAIERDRRLAEAPGHRGTLPSGGLVSYLSRDPIPAHYSGLTLSRMSPGRVAIVCLQLREGRFYPFRIIGPIVVG